MAAKDGPALWRVRGTKKGDLPVGVEKRSKGKVVTVVFNVDGDSAALLRALQRRMGVGGTSTRHTVEVQGEHKEVVELFLRDHRGHLVNVRGAKEAPAAPDEPPAPEVAQAPRAERRKPRHQKSREIPIPRVTPPAVPVRNSKPRCPMNWPYCSGWCYTPDEPGEDFNHLSRLTDSWWLLNDEVGNGSTPSARVGLRRHRSLAPSLPGGRDMSDTELVQALRVLGLSAEPCNCGDASHFRSRGSQKKEKIVQRQLDRVATHQPTLPAPTSTWRPRASVPMSRTAGPASYFRAGTAKQGQPPPAWRKNIAPATRGSSEHHHQALARAAQARKALPSLGQEDGTEWDPPEFEEEEEGDVDPSLRSYIWTGAASGRSKTHAQVSVIVPNQRLSRGPEPPPTAGLGPLGSAIGSPFPALAPDRREAVPSSGSCGGGKEGGGEEDELERALAASLSESQAARQRQDEDDRALEQALAASQQGAAGGVGGPAAASPYVSVDAELNVLARMGFFDRDVALSALEEANHDLSYAIELLLSGLAEEPDPGVTDHHGAGLQDGEEQASSQDEEGTASWWQDAAAAEKTPQEDHGFDIPEQEKQLPRGSAAGPNTAGAVDTGRVPQHSPGLFRDWLRTELEKAGLDEVYADYLETLLQDTAGASSEEQKMFDCCVALSEILAEMLPDRPEHSVQGLASEIALRYCEAEAG
uniref:UBA domain-containing protein n=1 Tax=Rhizochromulina marina TaxID=1034831 RepID=A0A7S2SVH2_9STRA|mmetsp:Transcript_9434/g.26674  ORF Transcript_9434/g.26674 Transcript_9434/m.26674 type:complete len:699 (+) Transcript_9434:136-2232(+)